MVVCDYASISASLIGRETGANLLGTAFTHAASNSRGLWQRMALDSLLAEHRGCVNYVEFNQQGTLLASGSDDMKLSLWNIQSDRQWAPTYPTSHTENIFCVKFMPTTPETQPRVATCAGDGLVIVHDVVSQVAFTFNHHQGRVKKLVTEPGNPHLIISCSEDGTVCQVDTRQPASQATQLLQLARNGVKLEINSISAPRLKPWLLAVGASDDLLRVYDRRTMGTTAGSRPRATGPKCVAHFTPGSQSDTFSSNCITGVACADDGSQVLANYIGDHVYLWSLDNTASSRPLGSQQTAAAQDVSRRRGKRSRHEEHCHETVGGEALVSDRRGNRQLSPGTIATVAAPQASDSMQADAPTAAAAEIGAGDLDGDDSAAPDAHGADEHIDRPASRVLSVDAALELHERGELRLPRRRRCAVASMILNRAQDLYEGGEVEASLRYATAALQLRPNFGMAHYQCAICHDRLGDPAAALAAGEAALQYAWGYDLQQFVRRLSRRMQQQQQQQHHIEQPQQHHQQQQHDDEQHQSHQHQQQQLHRDQQEQQQQQQHHHHYQQQHHHHQQQQQQLQHVDAFRPLPPALQQRLQARGILNPQHEPASPDSQLPGSGQTTAAAAAADVAAENVGDHALLVTAGAAPSGGSESWSPASADGSSSSRSSSSSSSSDDGGGSGAGSGSSSGHSGSSGQLDDIAAAEGPSSSDDGDRYRLGSGRVSHLTSGPADDDIGSSGSSSSNGDGSEPDSVGVSSVISSGVSLESEDDDSNEVGMEDMLGLDVRHTIYDWANTHPAAATDGNSPTIQQQQQQEGHTGSLQGGDDHSNDDTHRFGELLEPLRHQLLVLRMRRQRRLLDQLRQQGAQRQQNYPQLQDFLSQERQAIVQHNSVITANIWRLAMVLLREQQAQYEQQQEPAVTDGPIVCEGEYLALLPIYEEQPRISAHQLHVLSAVLFLLDMLPDPEGHKEQLMKLRTEFPLAVCSIWASSLEQQQQLEGQEQQDEEMVQRMATTRVLFMQYTARLRFIIGHQLDEWQTVYQEHLRLLQGLTLEDGVPASNVAAALAAAQICQVHLRLSHDQQQQQQQHPAEYAHQPHEAQQQQQQQGSAGVDVQPGGLQGVDDVNADEAHTIDPDALSPVSPSQHESDDDDDGGDELHAVLNAHDLLSERDPLICEIGEALAAGECGRSSSSKQLSTPPGASAGATSSRVGPVLLSEHASHLHSTGGPSSGTATFCSDAATGPAAVGCTTDISRRRHEWSCRYRGHLNLKTVKDVAFVGPGQTMVATGSDDGRLYVWDRCTGELITALRADRYVVNCVASHPNLPMMASCGIDNTIKIWTPCNDQPRPIDRNLFFCLGYNEIERTAERMLHQGFGDMCEAFSRQRAAQLLMQIRQDR